MTVLPKLATDILIRILPMLMERDSSWEPGFLLRAVLARLRSAPLMTKLRATQAEGLLLVLLSMILASERGHSGLDDFAAHRTRDPRASAEFDVLAGLRPSTSDDDSESLAAILAKSERFENGVVLPQDMLTPEELDAIGLEAARTTIHSLTLITS